MATAESKPDYLLLKRSKKESKIANRDIDQLLESSPLYAGGGPLRA